MDADSFDETNLNRQLYADLNSIGRRKTEAAENRVNLINDAVEFSSLTCEVEDLDDKAYEGVDLIFDCLDTVPSRLHIQDMGERLAIPVIHGAIGGWYGQVAVVWPGSQLLTNIYGPRQHGIEKELGNPEIADYVRKYLKAAAPAEKRMRIAKFLQNWVAGLHGVGTYQGSGPTQNQAMVLYRIEDLERKKRMAEELAAG